jgi:hypothetical protein
MRLMLLVLILLTRNVFEGSVCGAYMNPPDEGSFSHRQPGDVKGRLVSIPARQHANHSRTRHRNVDAYSAALIRQVRNERRLNNHVESRRRGVTPLTPVQSTKNFLGPPRAARISPSRPQQETSIAYRKSGELPLRPITEKNNHFPARSDIQPLHGTLGNKDSYIQEVGEHFRGDAQIQPNSNLAREGFHPAPQKTLTRTTVVEEFIIPQGTLGRSFNIPPTQEIPSLIPVLPST